MSVWSPSTSSRLRVLCITMPTSFNYLFSDTLSPSSLCYKECWVSSDERGQPLLRNMPRFWTVCSPSQPTMCQRLLKGKGRLTRAVLLHTLPQHHHIMIMYTCILCDCDREWQIDGEGRGHMCWVARQPSQLPYYWSVLTFSASTKEKGIEA